MSLDDYQHAAVNDLEWYLDEQTRETGERWPAACEFFLNVDPDDYPDQPGCDRCGHSKQDHGGKQQTTRDTTHWHLMWTLDGDVWRPQHSRPARDEGDHQFTVVEDGIYRANLRQDLVTLDRTVCAETVGAAWKRLDDEYPGLHAEWACRNQPMRPLGRLPWVNQ
jgi:hypothetical protein